MAFHDLMGRVNLTRDSYRRIAYGEDMPLYHVIGLQPGHSRVDGTLQRSISMLIQNVGHIHVYLDPQLEQSLIALLTGRGTPPQ